MKERLDEADLKILRLLQEDGRITNADLARQVGLSPPSMLQRVRKLEESGFIENYTTRLNHGALGYGLMVVAMVSLSLHQEKPIEQFVDAVRSIPEVLECLNVSGDCDFLLKIIAKDMADYERIVREKLSRVKGIGKINSCFVLGVNKNTSAIPL
ncbi:MAG: Lrp/AsnC family transcriptional regulator [Fimbriimonadaceae bacterium]|jgi:Lrp/AsnC family leucine-responsive transcriptional regulator|nr:Lrp/AsnC family transcriptional regulator [Fimbriimonadaceae bacterium]